ncbi:MAG: SdrD B-like domain-containing protein [Bacteroidota bacterium]
MMTTPAFVSVANSLSSSDVTSLTITVPAGNLDDLLLATVVTDGNTSFSTPSGWQLIDPTDGVGTASGDNATLAIYFRIADGSEPANYTFTWTGSEQAIGAISRYSNVDIANPIHALDVATGSSTNPTAPDITTTLDDVLLIRLFGADGDGGNFATVPSGTTEIFTGRSGSSNANAATLSLAHETQAFSGATGTAAFTNNNNAWRAFTIALVASNVPSCRPQNVTAYASPATCDGTTPNNDGQLTIATVTAADRYAFVTGNGFIANSGNPNYSAATPFNAAIDLPLVIATTLPNPATAQDYTIRLFNGETDCFRDVVVTLRAADCSTIGTFESRCNQDTDYTVVGTAGFEKDAPHNQKCITLADWGIDPTQVSQDFHVSLFFDGGLNSVTFTSENGQSVAGVKGDFFAEATLQNDGSTFICATVDASNNNTAEDMSFFSLIPTANSNPRLGYTGKGTPIDDEIFNQPCGSTAPTGSIPITLSGNPADLYDLQIDVPVSEVEAGDARTITLNFQACNSTFSQTINPEPLIGRPDGFNILTATLKNVPGNCTQIEYEFCSNPGEQSYGVAYVLVKYDCARVSIGSTVFQDDDNDGQFEKIDGESGIGGVKVNLYQVATILNGGFVDINNDGISNEDDDGFLAEVTVIDGRLDLSEDGQVQDDGSDDGMIDGLTVDDGLIVGVTDGSDIAVLVGMRTTASATSGNAMVGDYFFSNLSEGRYQVEIPNDNFTVNEPLFLYSLSSTVTDTQDNREDDDDNGIQSTGTGRTVSPIIELTNNQEPTGENGQGGNQDSNDDNNGDMTVDFGFTQGVGIGGTVYDDRGANGGTANNGFQESGEPGIPNVKVELTNSAGDVLSETRTDQDGNYLFTSLPPGIYRVRVPSTNFDGGEALNTLPFSSMITERQDNNMDCDDNGLQFTAAADTYTLDIELSLGGEPSGAAEPKFPLQDGTDGSVSDLNTNTTIDLGFQNLVLPVELLYFQAKGKERSILLNWETATETNNSHFELERSTDGKQFKSVGRIAGAGTTLSPQQYAYTDGNVQANIDYYYRLKQVDMADANGAAAFAYSAIVVANIDGKGQEQLDVFPNPVTHRLQYRLNNGTLVKKALLYDLQGRLLLEVTESMMNLEQLQSGVYLLVVQTDQQTFRRRIIKQY